MSDRGMLKWAPFNALEEQSSYLRKARDTKLLIEEPILSEDEVERINDILQNYHGENVIVEYYENGYIKSKMGVITKIDIIDKNIRINRAKITLQSIKNVQII